MGRVRATVAKLFKETSRTKLQTSAKISIIGTGAVGMAGAFAILIKGIATDIALIDAREGPVKGEAMDMLHGQAFMGLHCNIQGDTDYAVSRGSKVCIITAGARQGEGESRLDLVKKNVSIFKAIVPNIVKFSSDTIILVASNPCDIMAWVAWKVGKMAKHKVISTGTALDSSRFRQLVSERLSVGAQSIHGYIIGEHGDSSVAVWSSINIAGTRLKDISPMAGESPEKDPENWQEVHKEVIDAAYEIIKLKGFTNWGIGLSVAKITEIILKNMRTIVTVGTYVDGWNGIVQEVFMSIPVVLGDGGVSHLVHQKLTEPELRKVYEGAKILRRIMDGIQLDEEPQATQ